MDVLIAVAEDRATVSAGWLLLIWIAYTLLVLPTAAVVVGMKGRWIWLLVGLFTFGLAVVAAAFFEAEPDSAWARRKQRRQARRTAAA